MTNCAYETLCATWFMQGGWQVFMPLLDHGHKTDILISDGERYYRIQVKTLANASEKVELTNLWKGVKIDYVVYFAKNSTWGYVIPAFTTNNKKLTAAEGQKFQQNQKSFMKAFHKL